MRKPIRLARLAGAAVAVTLVAGACGSGDQLAAAEDQLGSVPTEDGKTTEASTQTTIQAVVQTTLPKPDETDVDSDPAFCEASADFWIADQTRGFIDLESPVEVRLAFQAIGQRLASAIDAAPNDELAAPAREAQRHYSAISAAVAQADYVWQDVLASPDLAALQPSIDGYDVILERLEGFLSSQCDQDPALLLPLSEELAAEYATAAAATSSAASGDPADTREVEDPTSRIRVRVPAHWTSEQGAPTGETAELLVSTDADQFRTSWAVDGVQLSLTEGTGAVDWRAPMYETAAADECTISDSKPYRDQLYTGWIDSYVDCPGGGTAFVIGATDEDLRFEILVEMQFDSNDSGNDQAVSTLILDSFEVR